MNVTNISQSNSNYDPFLLDALAIGKAPKPDELNSVDSVKPKGWEKQILLDALDKLENNISVDESGPLNYADAAPIETFTEAKNELKKLIEDNFSQYASQAQANLTPADILYLFEEETSITI